MSIPVEIPFSIWHKASWSTKNPRPAKKVPALAAGVIECTWTVNRSSNGFQIYSPYMVAAALVMMIPHTDVTTMKMGAQMSCPKSAALGVLAYRVQSDWPRHPLACDPTMDCRPKTAAQLSAEPLPVAGVDMRAPAPPAAFTDQPTMPNMVAVIMTKTTRKGSCSFSGGIMGRGRKMTMKTKKDIRLAVSTLADAGRVFGRSRNLGPMMALRIILTAGEVSVKNLIFPSLPVTTLSGKAVNFSLH